MLPFKITDNYFETKALNFFDKKTYESILTRSLSKLQLTSILQKLNILLKHEADPQKIIHLNSLKKEIRSKYSITISNDIIDKFISTTQKVNSQLQQLDFDCIDKQIRSSLEQINKKKYYINNQDKKETITKKILSVEKKKRRHNFTSITKSSANQTPSLKTFDHIFIREKLIIFNDYLDEEDINKFEQEILKKIQVISQRPYGKYSERIKHYTILELILQKVFNLVQENTKNIEIRIRFKKLYNKMKEEMVSIVINEEDIMNIIKKLKNSQENLPKNQSKQNFKKNHFQFQREKQDLTTQIEETIENAKMHLKEAFIKRGRPDYAYQMDLSLGNRISSGLKSLKTRSQL